MAYRRTVPNCCATSACVLIAACGASAQQLPFDLRVLGNTSYPTLPPGATIVGVSPPLIADDSTIAFHGSVRLANSQLVQSVLIDGINGPRIVARTGDPIGASGWQVSSQPWWNWWPLGSDRVIVHCGIQESGQISGPLAYILTGEELAPVAIASSAQTGFPVPHRASDPAARDGRCLVPTFNSLWYGTPTNLSQIAQSGEAVPTRPGWYFSSFWFPCVASESQAGFRALLSSTPGGTPNATGIFRIVDGAAQPVLLSGDPAPGLPGQLLTNFGPMCMNAPGQILFAVGIQSSGGGSPSPAICILDGQAVRVIARVGDHAPGTSSSFQTLVSAPATVIRFELGDGGHAIFTAELSGGDESLWIAGPQGPRLLARENGSVPGFPGHSHAFSQTMGVAVNGVGEAVFSTIARRPGQADLKAVMHADATGRAVPILRSYSPLPPNQWGVTRFTDFALAHFAGGASGGGTQFNNAGTLVVAAWPEIPAQPLTTNALLRVDVPRFCYPNCDLSLTPPTLNVADFTCFLQRYAAGDVYANCDQSTAPPLLNVADFACFLQQFAAGCP
jgi:hypothetical protein